jgi:serine/threonine protein phosphatase PrpC
VSRVCAILGVARALGDTFLQPMVTCMPDVFDVPFAQYDALILACDGLWDVVSDAEAAAVTLNAADAGDAARRLRDFAIARNSDDNISVLVVFFNNNQVKTWPSSNHKSLIVH